MTDVARASDDGWAGRKPVLDPSWLLAVFTDGISAGRKDNDRGPALSILCDGRRAPSPVLNEVTGKRSRVSKWQREKQTLTLRCDVSPCVRPRAEVNWWRKEFGMFDVVKLISAGSGYW